MISFIICILPKMLLGTLMRENEWVGHLVNRTDMRNLYTIVVKCLKTRSTCKT